MPGVLDPTTVYVLVVIFVATLIRSTLGFGEALVAVPLLALRTPIAVAAPLAVLMSVLVAGVIVVQDWRKVDVRSAGWLIASALLGIPLGLLLLARADDRVVRLILGLIIMAFSIYSLTARLKLHLERDRLVWLLGSGFCSGVLGGAYGMNGPPLVVYGSLRRWSAQHFRATLQAYFLPASLVGVGGYWGAGLLVPDVVRYFLLCLPGALVAILLGRAINHRLRGRAFLNYIHFGLIVIGITLLVQMVRR
jgi:uncharacterized membrane protein YfcA